MQIDEQKLTEILNDQKKSFKSDVEEFARGVGVMLEDTQSKLEFITEKVISIEEKLDTKVAEQASTNKSFDKRITKLEFEVGK